MGYARSTLLTRQRNEKRSYYQSVGDYRKTKQQYGLAKQEEETAEREGSIWDATEAGAKEKYEAYEGEEGILGKSMKGFYGEGGEGKGVYDIYEKLAKRFGFTRKMDEFNKTLQTTGGLSAYTNLGDDYISSDIGRAVYGTHGGKSRIEEHSKWKGIRDLASQGNVSIDTDTGETFTGKDAAFRLYGISIGKGGTEGTIDDWRNQNLGGGTWDRGDRFEFKGGRWTRQEHKRGKTKTGYFGIKYWDKDAIWWKEHDIHDQIMGTGDKLINKAYTENIYGEDYSLSDIDTDIKTIKDFKAGDPYQQFTSSYGESYGEYETSKTAWDTMTQRGSDYQTSMQRRKKARSAVPKAYSAMTDASKMQASAYKSFMGVTGGIGTGMGVDYQGRKAGFGYGGTV